MKVSSSTDCLEADLELIRHILADQLKPYRARIWLFGSRAAGNSKTASDIDIAVLPWKELPPGILSLLRDRFEDSNIPWKVDLVDLREVNRRFQKDVFENGVEWTD